MKGKEKGIKVSIQNKNQLNTEDSVEVNELKKRHKTQKTKSKMAEVSPSLSVVTLNVNKLIFPVKKEET